MFRCLMFDVNDRHLEEDGCFQEIVDSFVKEFETKTTDMRDVLRMNMENKPTIFLEACLSRLGWSPVAVLYELSFVSDHHFSYNSLVEDWS